MLEKYIEYEHDGDIFEAYLAVDQKRAKPLPGVMVSHTWRGRSDFECDKARNLAALGYVGFAIDLYGKGIMGANPEESAALMQPLLDDRGMLQRRITAAYEAFRQQPEVNDDHIVAMGYCFGGLCVLDLARTGIDLDGVVSFHGLLGKPGNTDGHKINCKVLVLHGHDDPMVPVDDVIALEQELSDAGADWQIHAYGNTMHAFTNPQANDPGFGTVYNEHADRRSWSALLQFLKESFE